MSRITRILAATRTTLLGLAALVGAWQDYRIQKAIRETATPLPRRLPEPAPFVSIVLPVRNEQAHLDACLSSLLSQRYPRFEVIVIDDGSSDATPRLLQAWAARDPRLRIQRLDHLPPGWAGKAHALHTGATLAQGDWLLFTDADTRHAPQTLRRMVAHACAQRLDLLSLIPQSRLEGLGALLLTPAGLTLITHFGTPGEMRDPGQPGRALAVGQYILVRREAYLAEGGYSAPQLRASFGDDIGLAQFLKRQGCREDIVDGRELVLNEQWLTWQSAWRGWRKSLYSVVAPLPLLGLGAGLSLIIYGLLPLAGVLQGLLHPPRTTRERLTLLTALLTLGVQIRSRRRLEHLLGKPAIRALSAPISWCAFGLLMLDTTRLALSGQSAEWKGRSAPEQPAVMEFAGSFIRRASERERRLTGQVTSAVEPEESGR
jgi:chlorobactene glucosyltransferase